MKSSRFLLSLVILLLAVALPSRAADAPLITAVSPRQVPAGSPGFTLVVQGRSFDKSSVVLCNGSERNTTWVSDHVLRAAILTSDIAKRRTLHIAVQRSEEHTSELQSPCNLVCRLLLEKKKKIHNQNSPNIKYTMSCS